MKNLILFVITFLTLGACKKESEIYPEPFGVDTVKPPDTSLFVNPLVRTTWFITAYRLGPLGSNIQLNDELKFESNNVFYYNGYTTKYSLTQTIDGYMLTLYETRWGNISGYIYDYNISSGSIDGIEFRNIMNNNSQKVYLWIVRE